MRPKGAGRKNLAPKNRETGDRETGGAKPKTGGPIVLQIIIVCTTNYLKLFYLIKLFYCCSANTRANWADKLWGYTLTDPARPIYTITLPEIYFGGD